MAYGIVLIVFACVLGLLKRRSRIVSVLIVLAMWVLMGLNTMNADYIQYQYLYDYKMADASGINAGYLAAEQIAWFFGLDFLQFRMLFAAVGLILIALFIRRYSESPNAVLSLYVLLPFMYDVVQFKFFLAASVAIFSMRFLIDKSRFYGIKFLVGIAIASLIHPAAFLFAAFSIGLLERKFAFKTSLFIMFVFLIAVYSGAAQQMSGAFLDSTKQSVYMSELGRFGWIPYFVSAVGSIALAHFASPLRYSDELPLDGSGEARFLHFFESAKYAFLPLLALLPLSLSNFYRPMRSGNVFFLMYFTAFAAGYQKGFPRAEKTALLILAIVWFVFTQVVLYNGVSDMVLAVELTNNLLWS